jgi:hypothetical protein
MMTTCAATVAIDRGYNKVISPPYIRNITGDISPPMKTDNIEMEGR